MKVEDTKNRPALDLLNPEKTDTKPVFDPREPTGARPQQESADITHVILTNGHTIPILKGSFHYYVTTGQKPLPYVTFDTIAIGNPQHEQVCRIETMPVNIAGIAYYVNDDRNAE